MNPLYHGKDKFQNIPSIIGIIRDLTLSASRGAVAAFAPNDSWAGIFTTIVFLSEHESILRQTIMTSTTWARMYMMVLPIAVRGGAYFFPLLSYLTTNGCFISYDTFCHTDLDHVHYLIRRRVPASGIRSAISLMLALFLVFPKLSTVQLRSLWHFHISVGYQMLHDIISMGRLKIGEWCLTLNNRFRHLALLHLIRMGF